MRGAGGGMHYVNCTQKSLRGAYAGDFLGEYHRAH